MTRPWFVLAVTTAAASCGASPAGPELVPPPPPPPPPALTGPYSLGGVVSTSQADAPIGDAVLQLTGNGVSAARTDSAGRFDLSQLPGGTLLLELSAPGHVSRRTRIELTASRSEVAFDLIPSSAPFDLTFYRRFVRNAYDAPGTLQPLRRWTQSPSFYIRTIVEGSGIDVPPEVINGLRRVFTYGVEELSRGQFRVAAIETGTETRPAADGWVMVTFVRELGFFKGRASVGGPRGTMELVYDPTFEPPPATIANGCEGPTVAVAEHEITHTMGFWHTDRLGEDFVARQPGCVGLGRSDRALYHAAIAYSRPPGNFDPDIDPSTFVSLLQTADVAPPTVSCVLPWGRE